MLWSGRWLAACLTTASCASSIDSSETFERSESAPPLALAALVRREGWATKQGTMADLDFFFPVQRRGWNTAPRCRLRSSSKLRVPVRPGPTVIRVPHHGSETSSTPAMLDRVQPDLAVLSVGRNYYGHPHDEVLARYARRGIPLWRTDVSGNVTVRLDATGLTVRTEREP